MSAVRRVLFVAYGGGHIPMALPVIRALRQAEPGIHIDLMALTAGHAAAVRAGEAAWQYRDFWHLVDAPAARAWGMQLAPSSSHPAVSDEESVAYHGINFWDLVEQHGLDAARSLYEQRGRHGFLPLSFFKRVIAQLRPDVVVATVSPRSEEAALLAAMEMGVPTLSMTDLFLAPSDPYNRRRVYADIVTAINAVARDALAAVGVPAQTLRVTGNPAFDGLKSAQTCERAAALRAELGWQRKTVVLWAGHADYDATSSQPLLDYPQAVEAQLRAWVAADDSRALIVRYHPNESHLFPATPPQLGVFVSTPTQPVHEAILAADVVVVQRSTVGLESAVAGKPVVALTHSPLCVRDAFDYEALGVAYAATRIEQLPERIAHALASGCASPELAAQPPAAPQVAALVLALATRGTRDAGGDTHTLDSTPNRPTIP